MHGHVPLIELTRGGTPENLHFGTVALADAAGRVLAQAGDAQRMVFTRSTIKALQALPFVQGGGARQFGFTQQQLALLCASHSGEPMHVDQVQAMLEQAGVPRRALQCGCHAPIFLDLGIAPAPGLVPDERHHNCSGKHAGFLAYCVQHGLPLQSYLDILHPLQQAIRRDLARCVRLPEDALAVGTDGCSAPNYAMPLARLAMAYARLSRGAADDEFGDSFAALGEAMCAHPELVSGTRRSDAAYMRAGRGDWIAKIGADGVQVLASRSRGQALAVKISDGNMNALHATTVEALDQLGWLDDAQRAELAPWRASAITSVRGNAVGERRPVFRLARV